MATAKVATSGSWDVVVTVRARQDYVSRFIETYTALGASRIFVYYDDPQKSFTLSAPRLSQTVCDADYWQGQRPRAIERRQMRNATHAATNSTSTWVLHCDIDEHISSVRPVSAVLAEVPPSCGCYVAPPAEVLFRQRPETVEDIFTARHFKSFRPGWKTTHSFWADVYGPLIDLTLAGFWGHRVGKSFIRRDCLADIGSMPIHMPGGPAYTRVAPIKSRELTLCHFDALLPEDWLAKHIDRVDGRVLAIWAGNKRNQLSTLIAATHAAEGLPGALALFDRMFVISDDVLERGLGAGTITLHYQAPNHALPNP